jgi:adenosine deaminase
VIELAAEIGYRDLPTLDEDALAAWFFQGESGSLERYLEAFRHTIGVMQTPEALQRVAEEAIVDLAADGVVYAELRFAPSLHRGRNLSRDEVIAAVLEGIERGCSATGIDAGIILDAMRQDDDSMEVATAALRYRDRGVVGFDLAGPEAGFPPHLHLAACRIAAGGGLGLTIHAGEGDGVRSIELALDPCGAARIGHGVRIVEDVRVEDGEVADVGPVAGRVLRDRIPLEVCPTSNLHTGMFASAADHPVGLLHRAGFAVTLNTDNQLMSRITPSDEYRLAVDQHGFDVADLKEVTLRAASAAFCDDEVRRRVVGRIEEGYPSG